LGYARARSKRRIACRSREALVPRANLLANIAAKNPIPKQGAQISGDLFFQLNGQVGNTTPGIQRTVRQNTLRRTGLQATPATPAMIALNRYIRR